MTIPVQLVSGAEAYGQKLTHRYEFFQGAWFLDVRLGFPWVPKVLGKPENKRLARSLLRRVVEECPGTKSVNRFDITPNKTTRTWDIEFEAEHDGGALVDESQFFISVNAGGN